jgi:general secretion pathway protein C
MILREKVVLSVNDRDEVLEIEKLDTATSGRPEITRRIQPSPSDNRTTSTQKISLNRSLIEEATQDIGKLMTDASIQPYFENGNPEGLRLSRIKMNSIFRKMGLRRGDIITGIDGQNIRSVDDALRLYDRLKSADNVKVEIKRRGRSRILDYNIQ